VDRGRAARGRGPPEARGLLAHPSPIEPGPRGSAQHERDRGDRRATDLPLGAEHAQRSEEPVHRDPGRRRGGELPSEEQQTGQAPRDPGTRIEPGDAALYGSSVVGRVVTGT